jgi:uncharacterized Zn finger protein (UPF0148 family)
MREIVCPSCGSFDRAEDGQVMCCPACRHVYTCEKSHDIEEQFKALELAFSEAFEAMQEAFKALEEAERALDIRANRSPSVFSLVFCRIKVQLIAWRARAATAKYREAKDAWMVFTRKETMYKLMSIGERAK